MLCVMFEIRDFNSQTPTFYAPPYFVLPPRAM